VATSRPAKDDQIAPDQTETRN